MATNQKISRFLGLAFLLQFITSVSSGLFFRPLWLVPENISATMPKVAENPNLLRVNILVDMLTAFCRHTDRHLRCPSPIYLFSALLSL